MDLSEWFQVPFTQHFTGVKDKDKTSYQVMSDPPHDGETVFRITGKDVVMGRGGSSQNHNGNVTFRKLVHHNKVRLVYHMYFSCIIVGYASSMVV